MTNCEHELKPLIKPVSPMLDTGSAFKGLSGEILTLKYCAKCGAVFAVRKGNRNG